MKNSSWQIAVYLCTVNDEMFYSTQLEIKNHHSKIPKEYKTLIYETVALLGPGSFLSRSTIETNLIKWK